MAAVAGAEVRVVREDEWASAFAATHAEAAGYDELIWRGWALTGASFLAWTRDEAPVGIAGGLRRRPVGSLFSPEERDLVAVWVAPEAAGASPAR